MKRILPKVQTCDGTPRTNDWNYGLGTNNWRLPPIPYT
jgi:hypothetical protein